MKAIISWTHQGLTYNKSNHFNFVPSKWHLHIPSFLYTLGNPSYFHHKQYNISHIPHYAARPMPKPPYALGEERRTGFFTWCCAFICAFIFTIVIVVGIVVFVGYLAIRPKVPLLYVHAARLDRFDYNQAGVLAVRLTIIMRAENHNMRAHVSFYDTKLILGYHGLSIAQLVADPFEVQKNTSTELNYVVESSPIPLDPPEQYLTEQSLAKTKTMPFFLKGNSRARWRVGPLGSVKFWLHINCRLQLPIDYTAVYPHCSTKSH